MTEKEKAKLKDSILDLANRDGEGTFFKDQFRNRLSHPRKDKDLLISLIKQIANDGLLEVSDEYTTKTDHKDEFMMSKTPEGMTFLEHDGGYVKQYRDLRRKQIWEFFRKDVVAVGGWIVAVITLIYTIFFS